MAEVFLAVQQGPEGFQRKVAVKRILPHLADIPQFQDMFLDEARLAAQLTHPNIAHIYEFGSIRGNFYIAMEHIEGVDLGSVILQGLSRPLPLEFTTRIIAEVCAALNYAHHLTDTEDEPLGIVHRDISPQNIMVSFDGAVKVLDFGIAKAAHHVERTQPGVVRGKFSYMSPEQVIGEKLDGRSDLFCAGIVLHELLAAQPLFPRTDAVAAMRQIREDKISTPAPGGQPIPTELNAVLMRALAKDPEDRFDTAADMQLELEQFLLSSGRLSNSVLLGRFFTEHYKEVRREQDDKAASQPLKEAEVFSTVGLQPAGPQLPRVEIVGDTAAMVARRGGSRPGQGSHPMQDAQAPTMELSDLDLHPAGQGLHLDTAAGTVPQPGPAPGPPAEKFHQATTEDTHPQDGGQGPARRRMLTALVAALGATVVVAGVAAGYLISPSGEAETERRAPPTLAPMGEHDPASPPESEPLGDTTSTAPTPPGPAALSHLPDSQVVSLRRWDAGSPGPPSRPRQASPRAKSPRVVSTSGASGALRVTRTGKTAGYLSVNTIPWTQVYLSGGRLLGITPLARASLPSGRHKLVLKNPSGIRREHPVIIRPGKVTRVRLNLKK